MADGLQQATGLWLNESKSGTKYMSGTIREAIPAGSKLFIFRNERKSKETDSDYRLMFEVPEREPELTGNDGHESQALPADEIPF